MPGWKSVATLLTDKENAGAALLDACKEVKGSDPVPVGSYRGFAMSVSFDAFRQEYTLLLKGQMTHRATLGTDPRGNLTRIDNALSSDAPAAGGGEEPAGQPLPAAGRRQGRRWVSPSHMEQELRDKSARLAELDVLLNMDGQGPPCAGGGACQEQPPLGAGGSETPGAAAQPRKETQTPRTGGAIT